MSKTGNAKHMAPEQYETFLHLGGQVFSLLFLERCSRAKNGKRRKKKGPTAGSTSACSPSQPTAQLFVL